MRTWSEIVPWLAASHCWLFEALLSPSAFCDCLIAALWNRCWLRSVWILYRLRRLSGTWLSALFQPSFLSFIYCWTPVVHLFKHFLVSALRCITRTNGSSDRSCIILCSSTTWGSDNRRTYFFEGAESTGLIPVAPRKETFSDIIGPAQRSWRWWSDNCLIVLCTRSRRL